MKEDKPQKKGKFSKRLKRGLGCCSLLLSLALFLGLIIGGLTLTGYTKDWTCDVILEDSYIWDKMDCASEDLAVEVEQGIDYSEFLERLESQKPEDRVAAIVEVVQPSVVGIGIENEVFGEQAIVGTGFVVSDDGLIATNHHVISQPGATYFVQAEGQEKSLKVEKVYEDVNNDIAILKVDEAANLSPLELGDAINAKVGQEVIAIGNPLGDLPGTVTKGIISALGRNVEISSGGLFNTRIENFEGVIQTDAAINPGNSGGPLIDMNGKVIGINFATVGGADNLSFALPIDRIKNRLNELKEYGEFRIPYLGVQYQDRVVFIEKRPLFAAQIVEVDPEGPAAKGGLKKGDFVIGFDGEDLSEKSLYQYIQGSSIGKKVKMNVIREKKEVEIELEIGVRK